MTKSQHFIDFSKPTPYVWRREWKRSLIVSSVLLPIIISMLSLLECISCFSSLSFNDVKLIFIFRWIFHSENVLRSSVVLPKYSLVFSRYCSIDSFLLPLLLHLINLSSKVPPVFFWFVVFKHVFIYICFEKLHHFFCGIAW